MTLYVFYNFENVRVLYIMLFCGLPQFYADRVDDDIEGPFMFLFDLLMNEPAYGISSSFYFQSMEEMGGSEILQIKSSLSTPNREISSGMCMLLILQVSEMNSACESSQQNNAMGLGSSCSHWLTSILISSSCLSDSKQ